MWRAYDWLMQTTQTVRERSRNIIRRAQVRDRFMQQSRCKLYNGRNALKFYHKGRLWV
jgi:hypothetical protein